MYDAFSGHDAGGLPQSQISSHYISGKQADVGELFRRGEAQFSLRICVVSLEKQRSPKPFAYKPQLNELLIQNVSQISSLYFD